MDYKSENNKNNKSDKYLEAGKIVNTHSFRGEVKIQSWCDTPEFLTQFGELFLDEAGEKKLEIIKARVSNNMVICSFEGIDTEEAAIKLKNSVVYIKRDDVALEDGTFFIRDLIGLEVFDFADKNIRYGELSDIFSNGANDVYVIKTDSGEVLIPNVPAFVKKVSLEEGILVSPIEGMF